MVLTERLRMVHQRLAGLEMSHVEDLGDEDDAMVADALQTETATNRDRLLREAGRLRAALDRVAAGRYGACLHCSARISQARLRALPEAEYCLRCQTEMER